MKKIKKIILLVALLLPVLILSSCLVESHKHTYEDKWTFDTVGHWHKATCEHTDLMGDYENHTFGAWTTIKESTETEEGTAERKCNICGYTETKKLDKLPHTHTFATTWTSDAEGHWHASTCGHDVTTPKEGHSYGAYVVTKDPTEDEVGKKERVCSVCGYKDIADVEKLAHTHKFADEYSTDENYHWYASTCNHPETEEKELHKFSSWTVTKNATETEVGSKERVCSVCGYKQTKAIDKLAHTHTFATTWTYDEEGHWHQATCEHTDVIVGYAAHTFGTDNKCTVCGYEKTGEITVDENYEATFAWSTDYSTVTVVIKSKTDASTVKTVELAPVKTEVSATCEAKGKDTYTISYTYKGVAYTDTKEVEIDALGHDYEFARIEWDDTNRTAKALYECKNNHDHKVEYDCVVTVKSASPKEDGSKCVVIYTATDDTHTDDNSYELDHTYGEWTTTKQATTTEEGTKERVCSCCGHKETESIPVLSGYALYDVIYDGTYYSSITSEMLSNADLLTETLHTLISSNYTKHSYSQAFNDLNTVDSYDGGDYVECIYTGEKMDPANHGYWNREHVWAKSHGIKTSDDGSTSDSKRNYAYSDLHHLRASENSINSTRNNRYFDEVPHNTTNKDNYGNYWDNSNAFEPRDEVKGDIARMLFYMTVRYTGDELSQYLRLVLTDDITNASTSINYVYGTTTTITSYLGKLSTLVKWSFDDPVDSREISRNNAIYTIQGNRNPFIDHPELVYYIFGTEALAAGVTVYNLQDKVAPLLKDDAKITNVQNLISSIGTMSAGNEASITAGGQAITAARTAYTALDSENKSFVNNYNVLVQKETQYEELTTVQDTTVNTSFSFLGLKGNKTGSLSSNGVHLNYESTSATAPSDTYGIYSQCDKNGNRSDITITVSDLYATITKVIVTADTNKTNSSGISGTITITDGTKTVSEDFVSPKSKNTSKDYILDVSTLNKSVTWTITISNDGFRDSSNKLTDSASWRTSSITFSVS